ncbi:MAG: hypothetical protein SVG88_02275 [Halobacteriales archaeon]|nr:hypothetical protein [Halobacteriales archaeon]
MPSPLALSQPTIAGGLVVLLVLIMLRYIDRIVDVIVSVDDSSTSDPFEGSESS